MPLQQQQLTSSSVFGCLLAASSGNQQFTDDGFLRAIIRYGRFNEIHLFAPLAELASLKSEWASYCLHYGSDKTILFLPAHELSKYFHEVAYQVFHQVDPWIGHLAALRDSCCSKSFPITGHANYLSTDATLSNSRNLLLSPLQRCDALLCNSQAQQKAMVSLLSAASASIFDQAGVAVSFKANVVTLPAGVEPDECIGLDAKKVQSDLGIKPDQLVILTPGDISPIRHMDLQPLLLVMNDLVEGYGLRNIQWVIAGAGDASNPAVQLLLKQVYELNLESTVRFELDIDGERMCQWLAACDLVLTLPESIHHGSDALPLTAMANGKAVVSSDWGGHGELLAGDCLIDTMTADMDHLARPVGTVLSDHAHLLLAQGTSVNLNQCSQTVARLIANPELRSEIGERNRQRVCESYLWESVIGQYHQLVSKLAKDVSQRTGLHKRPVGLPYHQVFQHFPSQQLEDSTRLATTDRGMRVLLGAEKVYHYAQMDGLLKPELIDDVARHALSGCTVATLKTVFSHDPSLILHIAWMCKYQLLAHADKPLAAHSQHRWWPEDQRLPAEIMARLECPEPRRFRLLEPLLYWLDQQLLNVHQQAENAELRASLLAFFATKLDEQLLQALGWVGELKQTRQYADILEEVIEQGGLSFLSDKYPLWYRLNRLLVIRLLKALQELFRRFYQDINDINKLLAGHWQKPVCGIGRVDFPLSSSSTLIAIITGDNGEKVVYKNRDLRVEQQIIGYTENHSNIAGSLNRWLKGQPGLATIRILPRSGAYGYCQFVEEADHNCLDEYQADAYYQRLGVIAGLAILLGLGDVHNRNVISKAGIPYLTDVKNAFSSGVIRAFEAELNDPQQAFLSPGNSFQKTGLTTVFESFHFPRFRRCRFQLHNGELVELSPVQEYPVGNNLIRVGEQNSLSGDRPLLCSQYAGSVEKGLESVFRAVMTHHQEWVALLQSCRGLSVCHLQRYDRDAFWRQYSDLWTFHGFQHFSRARCKSYFARLTTRLCQAEEEIQRWAEPKWFEPAARLSNELAHELLSGRVAEFRRVLGASVLFVGSGKDDASVVCQDYFSVDTLQRAIELCCDMASDVSKAERYLAFLTAVVKQWLLEKASPGRDFPEALRERLPG